MAERGRYIVAEGPDGSGKSTIARHIVENLREEGIEVHQTREPGGTPVAEAIRALVLSPEYSPHFYSEIAMFTAGRADLWHSSLKPKLENGIWVVSDRNYLSSIAYQGTARGFGTENVLESTRIFVGEEYMDPDLTLIMMPKDYEQGMERVMVRGATDRLEQEAIEFHKTVFEAYTNLLGGMGRVAIDASLDLEEVKANAWAEVKKLVPAESN